MIGRALLLNASYEPHEVISDREAVVKSVMGHADVVEYSDSVFRSPSTTVVVPSVLRLRRYVVLPEQRRSILLTTRNVLLRDEFVCAYCNAHLTRQTGTIDHVVPRSRGGLHRWENVTASCFGCNQAKGDHTPDEIGWTLDRACSRPVRLFAEDPDPAWVPYLSKR